MDRDEAMQQAMDEERRFSRCVELAELAERRGFSGDDLEDLRYELGVAAYFRRNHD